MLYFISDASKPVEYISCGNLASKDGFVHPKRNIDSFVLIIVIKGTLHITQNMTNYDVRENEFILLFPIPFITDITRQTGSCLITGCISM